MTFSSADRSGLDLSLFPEHRLYTHRYGFSYKCISATVLNDTKVVKYFHVSLDRPEPLRCSTSALPAGGAGSAAAGGDHVVFLRNMKTRQVQEISDHLTFDGNIQGCVGMKAEPETQQLNEGVV